MYEEHHLPPVPRRRIIRCKEWEDLALEAEELQVSGKLQVYDHISASKYLNVRISGEVVVFTTTHFIGHIPLNDHVALDVIPRFDVSNLTRLLRIAQHSPVPLEQFVRTYSVSNEPLPSIFDQLAAAFVHSVERVARSGLLTSYRRAAGSTSYPRGRVLLHSTVHQHHARGARFAVASSWFEHSVDNAPNRLLKYTMWLLDRRLAAAISRKGVAKLRTKLNQYYGLFEGVYLDQSRRFLQAPDVLDFKRLPIVRSYYLQALQLATLLIREDSLDLGKRGGTIRAPSMLIDLQEGFEGYLRNSLSHRLSEEGSQLQVLNGNLAPPLGARKNLYKESSLRRATPDIVVRVGEENKYTLLIEVKYKEHPSREDINQVIAYGVSYNCPSVVLAHARREGQYAYLQFQGSVGSMKVYHYAYDLARDLPTEEKIFVETVQKLCA